MATLYALNRHSEAEAPGGPPVRGNLVPDAHLVALMRQHGVSTIWSHDRDFLKFPGIKVQDPFA
jgi:predicted nucleic acid-binding protein